MKKRLGNRVAHFWFCLIANFGVMKDGDTRSGENAHDVVTGNGVRNGSSPVRYP